MTCMIKMRDQNNWNNMYKQNIYKLLIINGKNTSIYVLNFRSLRRLRHILIYYGILFD